jgi:preprotein translocase subunit SecE
MKKQKQRQKKGKNPKRKSVASRQKQAKNSDVPVAQKSPAKKKPVRSVTKKTIEGKKAEERSAIRYVSVAGQFLKDSRMELKKVKWPTRKELLATTAVVIVLTLLVAFFLGLVDFGLIKIIKNIVG